MMHKLLQPALIGVVCYCMALLFVFLLKDSASIGSNTYASEEQVVFYALFAIIIFVLSLIRLWIGKSKMITGIHIGTLLLLLAAETALVW
jgi:hypothetical protein